MAAEHDSPCGYLPNGDFYIANGDNRTIYTRKPEDWSQGIEKVYQEKVQIYETKCNELKESGNVCH